MRIFLCVLLLINSAHSQICPHPWKMIIPKLLNDIRYPMAPSGIVSPSRLEELANRYIHFTTEIDDPLEEGIQTSSHRMIRLASKDEIEQLALELANNPQFDPDSLLEILIQRQSLNISDPNERLLYVIENLNQAAAISDSVDVASQGVNKAKNLHRVRSEMQGPTGVYRKESPDLSGCLMRTGGNCVARSSVWSTVMSKRVQEAVSENPQMTFGIQVFQDHVEPLLYQLNPNGGPPTVIRLVEGSKIALDPTPIVSPQILYLPSHLRFSDPRFYVYSNPDARTVYAMGDIPDWSFSSTTAIRSHRYPPETVRSGAHSFPVEKTADFILLKILPTLSAYSILVGLENAPGLATDPIQICENPNESKTSNRYISTMFLKQHSLDICIPEFAEEYLSPEINPTLSSQIRSVDGLMRARETKLINQCLQDVPALENFQSLHFWGAAPDVEMDKALSRLSYLYKNVENQWVEDDVQLDRAFNQRMSLIRISPTLPFSSFVELDAARIKSNNYLNARRTITEFQRQICDFKINLIENEKERRRIVETMLINNTPEQNQKWLDTLEKVCGSLSEINPS